MHLQNYLIIMSLLVLLACDKIASQKSSIINRFKRSDELTPPGTKPKSWCGKLDAKQSSFMRRPWMKNNLTYSITKYSANLTSYQVDVCIGKAFSLWSNAVNLTFRFVPNNTNVDIEIRFEIGKHNDFDPFDGPNGTYGHAYYPYQNEYSGQVHFDDNEMFSLDYTKEGIDFLQVAVHEIGHAIGLAHLDNEDSVMFKSYGGFIKDFNKLNSIDIITVQDFYYKETGKQLAMVRPNFKDTTLCAKDLQIDAIVTLANKQTFVFKGKNCWKISEKGLAKHETYPKNIYDVFYGLPSDIDAGFTLDKGETYFFKGSEYWRFSNFKMEDNYPKNISDGFKGIPNNIGAAFVWPNTDRIFFLQTFNYSIFNNNKTPSLSDKLRFLLPNAVDAAFKYVDNSVYLFKNGYYAKLPLVTLLKSKRDTLNRIDFNRTIGKWWLGCEEDNSYATYDPLDIRFEGRGNQSHPNNKNDSSSGSESAGTLKSIEKSGGKQVAFTLICFLFVKLSILNY